MRIKIKNIGVPIVGMIIGFLMLAPFRNSFLMGFMPLSGAQESTDDEILKKEVEKPADLEDLDLTGDEILKKEDENSPDSEITISEMTIIHKSGSKRVRKIKAWLKGEDSTLVRFLSPANIKGTGFLSVGDNDWLYLPALKKVRRIATKDKGGSFMGSDFSYDDVGGYSWEEDFHTKLLGVEKYNEHDCYILELTPKNPKDISYSRIKRWIDKEHFYSLKTEYYDIHGDLLKVLYSSEFEKKEGLWITKRMEMQNVQKGSKTVIEIKETELNPNIPDRMFTTRQLEKK